MPQFKFKLLAGRYSLNVGTDTNPKLAKFSMGDIVETDLELDKMFNSPGSTKFERLEHVQEDTEEYLAKLEADLQKRKAALAKKHEEKPVDDDLSKKSLADLQDIAKMNGIGLGKAKTREEVLKVIREALVEA